MNENPAAHRWRYLAYSEFGIGALILLFGGYVLHRSLSYPATDPHGFVLLLGGLSIITSALLAAGAAGLLWLRRWYWLPHLPLACWTVFLLVA